MILQGVRSYSKAAYELQQRMYHLFWRVLMDETKNYGCVYPLDIFLPTIIFLKDRLYYFTNGIMVAHRIIM
ncbi:MAG: hypothetical protein ACI9XB_003059 [Gammaproteobacteria bacterium]